MKAFIAILTVVFFSLSSFAQEGKDLPIAKNSDSKVSDLKLFTPAKIQHQSGFYQFGQFNIPQIEGFSFVSDKKMDMLSLGKEMGFGRTQSNYKFPEGQNLSPDSPLIRHNKNNFKVQTEAYLNPDNKRTPDGGIRNEVYEGSEQPFMNPYYSPYYRRSTNFHYGRQQMGNSNFYFSRR